jgi:hypothetical protein
MDLLETIYEMFRKKPGLDRLPFEELQVRYRSEPTLVLKEFIRRVQPLVFQAALEFLRRTHSPAAQSDVEEASLKVFEDFTPEFTNGSPSTLLVRFAAAIKRILDDTAFEVIATRYYHQVPLYHLKDDQQRRLLAATYQRGVGPDLVEYLAERFQLPTDEVERGLAEANKSLKRLIEKDFTEADLRTMTEGRVRRETT